MSAMYPTDANAASPVLPASLVLLMAATAGLAVASIYYAQPMLGVLAGEIDASPRAVGWVPTLTQLGYASGILLLAPLGDRYDRRSIMLAKAIALVFALLLAGLSPSIGPLLVASFAIGLTATLAQDVIPAAAALAPEASRGKVVGTVMTGLLLGILLSRVVSGFVAQHFDWRTMFLMAAASVALLALAIRRGLPRFRPTTQLGYGDLLGSLLALWRRHPALRRATLAQGLLSIGFSGFWSTLAVMLHGEPFHLGSSAAGAFGLAGAAGALIAPVAGRLADRHGPERVTRLGAAAFALSFAAMALAIGGSVQAQLVWLVIGTVGFDLGVQATLIAHQTIVFGIEPAARSRLNAVLITGMFFGMAAGAAIASALLASFGWVGVTGLGLAMGLAALATRLWPSH